MIITRGLLVGMVLFGFFATGATTRTHADKDGKAIFSDAKCSNCHSISSQGIKGLRKEGGAKPNDLSNTGGKFKAAWIEKWLLKEETLNNKKHMRKFKGTPEELHTLAAWLETLKDSSKEPKK
jgi:mono/diheme cytochrome c family protein